MLPALFALLLPLAFQTSAEEVVVTASAHEVDALAEPWSLSTVTLDGLGARSFPEALRGLPSVLGQKTAYGMSSPYIRGFTGYQTMLLVDGVRLNHAAMRAGPNQYWSTVDAYALAGVEVLRGPSSVLYGSDAIGGTVNALPRLAARGAEGSGTSYGGSILVRFASAEDSLLGRLEIEAASDDNWALLGGWTSKHFGDLTAGAATGEQPATGYGEGDGDLRLERWLNNGVHLTIAAQTARLQDVPRTHKTVDGISFHGTTVGSEILRQHDQIRDLAYARADWDRAGGLFDRGEITLSFQRHDETRDRERSGDRRDIQGIDVGDWGLNARFGAAGGWDWGIEAHNQSIDSFKNSFDPGTGTWSAAIQGPVGDDSRVEDAALYVQRRMELDEDWTLVPGVRVTRASVSSGRVQDPDTGLPTTLDRDWNAAAGSLRLIRWTGENSQIYGGLSQGFRTPSLYDLTSLDETSVVETPEFDLDPEHFLQAEIGSKGFWSDGVWQVSLWRTWLDEMIVRSPEDSTGSSVGKANGDGWMHGLEVDLTWVLTAHWSLRALGSWMDGEVEQRVGEDGVAFEDLDVVDAPVDRLMPLQGLLSARWTAIDQRTWFEGTVWTMGDADQLSFRDERDTTRIPADGTPGFTVLGLGAGRVLSDRVNLVVRFDNLTDVDYRVHGSGLNGPGRNLVGMVEFRF